MPLYEKVRVINSIFMTLFMKKDNFTIDEIKQLNLRYLIISKKGKNSIIDRCFQFYNNFTDSITEDSEIFPYLLNINSGCGFIIKKKYILLI